MAYLLVYEGDSLSVQAQGGGTALPAHVAPHLTDPAANTYQRAVAGNTITNMIAQAPTDVDPLFDATRQNVLNMWGGTNDLADGDTAATAYNRLVTYCQARKTSNPWWDIAVGTLIARHVPTWTVTQTSTFEAARLSFNASVRANYRSFAEALSDQGADPIMGQAAQADNTTYFFDGTHPTDAGREIESVYVAGAVNYLRLLDAGRPYTATGAKSRWRVLYGGVPVEAASRVA